MGNQLAQPQKSQADHVAEIPNVVLKENLGGGRLLKTVLCVHDEGGQVVVKVYIKRGNVELETYAQQLLHVRTRLSNLPCSHVWPFQNFFYTDKAAYLIRQHVYSNLYHRLSTRPFLAAVEKSWITFQLLHGLAQSHDQGICHGDIKCENVLLTSWNWAFLADFASYKPTRLPADNPADFSFFFDTGGRRRCYIAPERFFANDAADAAIAFDSALQPSMDVFSLGCVIAELFLEGQRLFDLSELLAYKRGEFSPTDALAKVEAPFRNLVLSMIDLDPGVRLGAAEYLLEWGPALFPPYFDSVLHPFFCSFVHRDPDGRIAAIAKDLPLIAEVILGTDAVDAMSLGGGDDGGFQSSTDRSAADREAAGDEDSTNSVEFGRSRVRELLGRANELTATLQKPMPQAAGSSSRRQRDAGTRVPESQGKLAVVEEAFEYQCREKGRAFGEATPAGRRIALQEWTPPSETPKEDIALPSEPGWQWTDEWRVDQGLAADARGWTYMTVSTEAEPAWAPKCRSACLWRRRRWTRQRRKRGADGRMLQERRGNASWQGDAEGMVILATLLCSTLRGARLQERKVQAIALLTKVARYCDDDARLQRIIPYFMECMRTTTAGVRFAALQGLVSVFACVHTLPTGDAEVFAKYIMPALSIVPASKEEWIRAACAAAIGPLGESAYRVCMDTSRGSTTVQRDAKVAVMRTAVERLASEAVTGAGGTPATRRNLLSGISQLASFLGRRETNDFLLPLMMTFLNSGDWQLRAEFFDAVKGIAQSAGPAGVEASLLPCLMQALKDRQTEVVARALDFLAHVTAAGLLRRRAILRLLTPKQEPHILPRMLEHHSASVRAGAAEFAAAAARLLDAAEAHVFLKPSVAPAFVSGIDKLQPSDFSAARLSRRPLGESQGMATRCGATGDATKTHLLVPRAASCYSIELPRDVAQSAESYLVLAFRSARQAGQGSARDAAPHPGSQDLVASARRLAPASADAVSVHGRLASGLQIGSDEALSFQADSMRDPSPVGGTAVSSAMDAAIRSNLPTYSPRKAIDALQWRPGGQLVTHLAEHKGAVNRVEVAANAAFFATASDDGSVKIWDSRRLEKDVTFRSRLTYTSQGGQILDCVACQDDRSMASASSDGSVCVWRVDYTTRPGGTPERYTGVTGTQRLEPREGAILRLLSWNGGVIYSTQSGMLHAHDLRSGKDAWVLEAGAKEGCWNHLAADEAAHWLLAGSYRGAISLWDLRFQICASSWSIGAGQRIHSITPASASPARLGLPRLEVSSPLIYVASGDREVSLWDAGRGGCHQVIRAAELSRHSSGNEATSARQSVESRTEAGSDGPISHSRAYQQGVHALLPTPAGPLLSGSGDGCIRCWDAAHAKQSYIVSTPSAVAGHAQYRPATRVSRRTVEQRSVIEEIELPAAPAAPATGAHTPQIAPGHADCVLSLAALHRAGEPVLLSASADGVVKAWR